MTNDQTPLLPIVGIEALRLYTSPYYLDMDDFAIARGEDADKFHTGLGQDRMSVIPPDEDTVTLALNAAYPLLADQDPSEITAVLFATESGIDQSKSAGAFMHGLLNLSSRCRVIELKHACYGGTAALQMAANIVRINPKEKVLVIAADVARYDLGSPGEATQGCGAVAMLVSNQPRVLAIEVGSGFYTEDVMDFWRPNYRDTALVDGKYSTMVYLTALKHAWAHFQEARGVGYEDIARFCYHLPFTKMAVKAHGRLMKLSDLPAEVQEVDHKMQDSLHYNRLVGNSYSASLYFGLASLLDHDASDLTQQRIGLFSYGSGCVGEFFTGVVQAGYHQGCSSSAHQTLISERKRIDFSQYLSFYTQSGWLEQRDQLVLPQMTTGRFRLAAIRDHKRLYVDQQSSS